MSEFHRKARLGSGRRTTSRGSASTRRLRVVTGPVGPFAGGPPADALKVEKAELTKFGIAEFTRVISVVGVLSATTARASARWAVHPRRTRFADTVSEGVVDGLIALGPSFVKLGQLMASSSGVFPKPLADACLRCLDEVPPFPSKRARAMIEADLGHPIDSLFASFDDVPLSAASVAQVHACVLTDGRNAVVKVQRPGIGRRMIVDIRAAYRFAEILEKLFEFHRIANATGIIRDLHNATMIELNSAVEAVNQDRIRTNFSAFGDNQGVTAPEIYWDYCGPRVICMERMYGVPLDRFDELADRNLDTELLIRRGVKAWIESVLVHGPFHGDVHAGNLWVLDDGRLALLDFGIVGELPEHWQTLLRDVFYSNAIDGDFSRVARGMRELGYALTADGSDSQIGDDLQIALAPLLAGFLSDMSIAKLINGLIDVGKRWGMSSPEDLVLLGKQIGYFERYATELAPDWNLGGDLYLFRNVFPEAVSEKVTRTGTALPD